MYKDIYQMKQRGFKVRRIARTLGIPRTKIYKYVEQSPKNMTEWKSKDQGRKKLDQFEMLIHTWLSENPDLSNTQIHDRLRKRYTDLNVSVSTVGSYVKEMRVAYSIPKSDSTKQQEGA